jgi:hypothetical protein
MVDKTAALSLLGDTVNQLHGFFRKRHIDPTVHCVITSFHVICHMFIRGLGRLEIHDRVFSVHFGKEIDHANKGQIQADDVWFKRLLNRHNLPKAMELPFAKLLYQPRPVAWSFSERHQLRTYFFLT